MQGTGCTTIAGPREPLYNSGVAAGTPSRFRFVGSQVTTPGGLTVNPNHECRTGYVVKTPPGGGAGSLIDLVGTNFMPYDADIVMINGGVNDLDPGVNNDTAANLLTYWSSLLDAVNAKLSRSWQQIVALNLLKRLDGTDSKHVTFNAGIGAVISGKSYAPRVTLVDIYNCVTRQVVGQGYGDAIHPNDEGCGNIATTVWANTSFRAALVAARAKAILP